MSGKRLGDGTINCLLSRAIQPFGLEYEVFRKAVVKNAKARAQDRFRRRPFLCAIQAPGKTHRGAKSE